MRAGLMCVVYKKALLVGGKAGGSRQWQEAARIGSGGGGGTGRPSGSGDIDGDDDVSAEVASPDGVEASPASSVTKAEVATLMSVDAGRVINMLGAFHELWSLPMQTAVALYLLYLQVRTRG